MKKWVHNSIETYDLKKVNRMVTGPPKKWQLDQRRKAN